MEQHPTYNERIHTLAACKLEHNRRKMAREGYHDIDDHGYIPWDEPIPFQRVSNHPNGGSYGIRCVGENFRRYLDVHPVYINPYSSLAGAWVGTIPGMGGWRPEDHPVHLYPLHQKYQIYSSGIGAANHLGPDLRIGLELGWGGLRRKIQHYRAFNHPEPTDFYDGEEDLVAGIQDWIGRHVVKAREMAASEPNPALRDNLLSIAEMNEWLVENPPRTLREACQFLAWFQSVDRTWAMGGAGGQLDELLRPYYESDMKAGIHDDDGVSYADAAIWHIASLYINDTHYYQIGGPAPDGHDLTSPVSYLVLEAVHRLRIPINLAVRVHDRLDPQLLRRAVEYHLLDGTGPSFSLSGGLDQGFARNGFPMPLARLRAKVGCNWTALPGIEYSLQDVTRQSLIRPLLIALEELVADATAPRTMEEIWSRYAHHLAASVELMKEGFDWHMAHHSKNFPEIVLNLFCHGTVERGLDVAEGGVDIVNIAVDGVGLATVADSFAAIEQRVVVEQRLTLEELFRHLENNWEGAERVRLMMRNGPRYGAGGSRGDYWAERISKTYCDLVKSKPTPNGYNIIPGLFSHGDIVRFGQRLGATPNGRFAGASISHSTNPDPGFARDGGAAPTAKANAVALTQPGWGNSAPLQLDVDSHLMQEIGGLEAVEALIKAHNAMGGTLINLNVVSKEQILEAHADPSKYPDLVVRVTGYSAYFHSLSPEYRQQIVDRFLGQ
jgi:formate C-acetyltransferase